MILSLELRTALLVAVCLVSIWLVTLVLKNGTDKKLNQFFFGLVFCLLVWEWTTYLSFYPGLEAYALFFPRLSMTGALGINALPVLLVYYLTYHKFPSKKILFILLFPIVILAPLTLSPYIFSGIAISATKIQTFVGPAMPLFSIYALVTFGLSIYFLINAFRIKTGVERYRIVLVTSGLIGMYAGFCFTVMLPIIIFANAYFVQFGALYILFFLLATALAIIKYQLFDIKIFATKIIVSLIVSLFILQLFFSDTQNFESSNTAIIFKFSFAFFVAILGLMLIRTMQREFEQREKLVRLEALEETNKKLLALDLQKTEFLNIAAHQLRTPVSIIRNYISMLKDGDYGVLPAEVQEVHNNIYQSNQWLVKLAEEFLDIAHLESGQTKYSRRPGDLRAVIDTVISELKTRAEHKKLALNYERPTEPLNASFDEEKIKHVIFNFIDNAIKYTQEGRIVVKVEKVGDGVIVTVTDTGIGFDAEDQKNFFQKFQRGKNANQIEVNTSTGLGLYICRKFVEGHGGKVWAKSDGVGKGSEFGFILPV